MAAAPEASEIAFLRYFYEAAGEAFGPADHDIYCGIMEAFEESTQMLVPEAYREGMLPDIEYDEGLEDNG